MVLIANLIFSTFCEQMKVYDILCLPLLLVFQKNKRTIVGNIVFINLFIFEYKKGHKKGYTGFMFYFRTWFGTYNCSLTFIYKKRKACLCTIKPRVIEIQKKFIYIMTINGLDRYSIILTKFISNKREAADI